MQAPCGSCPRLESNVTDARIVKQLLDTAELIGREQLLYNPGELEVIDEAVLLSGYDGWTETALTKAERAAVIAAYRAGVAARERASRERSKMLKRLRADPRAHEQKPRSTLVVPLNAKALAQLKRALGRGQAEEPRDAPYSFDA
jgi:hypothetical protein